MRAIQSINVEVLVGPDERAAVRDAVACQSRPRTWRDSEFAMTKSEADDVLRAFEAELANRSVGDPCLVTMTADQWCVLKGELARYYVVSRGRARESALATFAAIDRALRADPEVLRILDEVERVESSERRVLRLQRLLERAERRLAAAARPREDS